MDRSTFMEFRDCIGLLSLTSLIVVAAGCVDNGDGGTGIIECEGACDGFSSVSLTICEERAVATGYPDCPEVSARDIGIDPLIPEVPVRFYVAVEGIASVAGAQLALRFYDENDTAVRTIDIHDLSDGSKVVDWDGHDDSGNDVVSPFHTAQLEVTANGETASSAGHTIATLITLPNEGPGFFHHLGTDARDTDDWGRVHVIEALQDIGSNWEHRNRLVYLDLSTHNGGEFRPHHFHRHGECLDMRFVRTDTEGPLDLRWGTAHYDREATQKLVDMFFEHGALEVYADQRANLDGDNVVHVAGHSNHLHVSFGFTPDDRAAGRAINQGFVGGPCADDSDCPLRDGFCLIDVGEAVGTCTRECEGACSDYVGGIYTLSECVTVDSQRLCMPARDFERYTDTGCRAGLTAQQLPSLDHNNAQTAVCAP